MAAAFVNNGFRRVRKASVTYVMQQTRQTDELPGDGQRRFFQFGNLLEVPLQEVSARGRELVKPPTRKLHDAESVLEPGVRRAGIQELGQSQLTNVSQALKNPVVKNLALVFGKPDKPVDRTTNTKA